MAECGGIEGQLEQAAHALVSFASESGLTVSTAESLTAGLVASTIAGVPGASAVLRGGAVTYVNEVKEAVLGVDAEAIARYTEVSHPVARQMAEGSRRLFGADVAVSLTGYAGPGGGTEQDPVGTVYLGVASARGVDSRRVSLEGDRAAVRAGSALCALQMLLEELTELTSS